MPNLVTLADVRQAVPRLAATADVEISRLITEASDAIESYCRRDFGQATQTEVISTSGDGHIFLRDRPIASIVSITVGLPNSPRVLDPTTYSFDPLTGEIRGAVRGGFFPGDFGGTWWPHGGGFQSVQVVYLAGYSPVPPAVAGRALAMISRAATGLATDAAMKSKTMGRISYTIDVMAVGLLTDADRLILSRYRNYSLGTPS